MKPTTPLWLLGKYKRELLERLVPLNKTEVGGLKFYYLRKGSPPQDPSVLSVQGHEFHDRVDSIHGNTAIDVGANIGSYTLRLTKGFQKVVAFEPDPFNRHILKLNINLNNLSNVQVEEAALSDRSGRMPLFIQSNLGGTSSLNPHHYGLDYDRTIVVRVARLDDFNLGQVDFIKIDAEGYELRILKGASKTIDRTKPVLGVEIHCSRSTSGDRCDCGTCVFLRSLNYDLKLLGKFASTPTHWIWAEPPESRDMRG